MNIFKEFSRSCTYQEENASDNKGINLFGYTVKHGICHVFHFRKHRDFMRLQQSGASSFSTLYSLAALTIGMEAPEPFRVRADGSNLKRTLQQATEAHRFVRRRGSHIF